MQRWALSADAGTFLRTMPESVQAVVLASFRSSGTMDGNVWGRLFGFVRSVWSQRIGVDSQSFATMRAMTEESQMAVMMRHNQEQESAAEVAAQIQASAAEGNVGHDSRFSGGDAALPGLGGMSDEDAVANFVARCGLTSVAGAAEQLLMGMDPECRAAVIADFDVGGTKDGNVFGRLRGFVNAVENRRKRLRGAAYSRNVRPRY